MVCHQTYKDNNNNWLSPEEIHSEDGKNFFIKNEPDHKVTVGPSESMSKSKQEKLELNKELNIFTNQAIDKINLALEKFRYNVIIAVFHEVYAFLNKLAEKNINNSNLKENYKKILIVMMPVIPHITNECLEKIDEKKDIKWPSVKKEFIENDKVNIVIQVNGKKRSIITVEKNLEEKVLIQKIKQDKLIDKYIENKEIIRTIYIKDKIINVIIR